MQQVITIMKLVTDDEVYIGYELQGEIYGFGETKPYESTASILFRMPEKFKPSPSNLLWEETGEYFLITYDLREVNNERLH